MSVQRGKMRKLYTGAKSAGAAARAHAASRDLALAGVGCVRRRLTVRSNPPGALVYVDNYEIGTTPCSTDFTYYGTREIRLVKPGYETLTVMQPVKAPWYQTPGIDFFSDNLALHNITDRHDFQYAMQPRALPSNRDVLDRAQQLRSNALIGGP